MRIVESRNLKVSIKDRDYLLVSAWQTLSLLMGCTIREVSVTEIEGGYKAEAEVCRLDSGAVVVKGSGICTRSESRWRDVDEYAIRGMACTRAISRAARNTFGGIVGIAATFVGLVACDADGAGAVTRTGVPGRLLNWHGGYDVRNELLGATGARRIFPLCFRWQAFTGPLGVRRRVMATYAYNRVIHAMLDG